jgi:hypothetical protein
VNALLHKRKAPADVVLCKLIHKQVIRVAVADKCPTIPFSSHQYNCSSTILFRNALVRKLHSVAVAAGAETGDFFPLVPRIPFCSRLAIIPQWQLRIHPICPPRNPNSFSQLSETGLSLMALQLDHHQTSFLVKQILTGCWLQPRQ